MQNISAIFHNLFNLVSRPGDEFIDKECGHQPNVKSLEAGSCSNKSFFMSEIRRDFPQENNAGTQFDRHDSRSSPPDYQTAALIETPNFSSAENTELGGMTRSNKASQIAVDAFHQHIIRNDLILMQSDIKAGFKCDETYKVGRVSMTPFQYAMWQGNVDAMKVLLPHTSRNYIALAFLNAYDDAYLEELVKILPAAKEILTVMELKADLKYPLRQCTNFIERLEARL